MEKKLGQIILEDWTPSIITAILGGIIVALITPAIQSHYAEQNALAERKLKILESIGQNMNCFIGAQFQLVDIDNYRAMLEKSGKKVDFQADNREPEYRQKRDECSSNLHSDFIFASFYFDTSVAKQIHEYHNWVYGIRVATIENMPPRKAFEDWRDRIMGAILKNLGQRRNN